MGITISEAARTWGVSRNTIHQKIRLGVLSKNSENKIDPAEMVRVFGKPKNKSTAQDTVTQDNQLHISTSQNDALLHQITLEKQRRELAEKQVEEYKKLLDRAENRVDELLKNISDLSQTVKLLEPPKKSKKVWFSFFRK